MERRLEVLEIRLARLRTERRPQIGVLVAVMVMVVGGATTAGVLSTAEAAGPPPRSVPHERASGPEDEGSQATPSSIEPAPPATSSTTTEVPESTEPPDTDAPEPPTPTEPTDPPEPTQPPESTEPPPPETTEPPPETTEPPATDPSETTEPQTTVPVDTDPPEATQPPVTTGPDGTEPPVSTEPPVDTRPSESTAPPLSTEVPLPPSTTAPELGNTSTSDDESPDDEGEQPAAGLEREPVGPLPDTNPDWLSSGSGRLPAGEPGASQPVAGRVPAVTRWHPTDDVEVILATIRQLESGGRYRIGPNKAGASGAYQFIPSTWNHYSGYPEAYLAPREVQDAKARADVVRFLQMHDGDVSMVPVLWYYPRAATEPEWMDRVPNPAGGNLLTVRQYQQRWLQALQRKQAQMRPNDEAEPEPGAVSVLNESTFSATSSEISRGRVTTTGERSDSESPHELDRSAGGRPRTHNTGTLDPETPADRHRTSGAPTTGEELAITVDEITVSDETTTAAARSMPPGDDLPDHGAGSRRSITFPVLGPVTYHDGWGDCRDGCARRHEGTDLIGVRMQPLLAAVDGTIHTQRYESQGTAGVILSIIDDQGWRYNYFHNNNDTPSTDDGQAAAEWRFPPGLQEGDRVQAGQIVGYMGDSGNSEHSVPHLHFEFRDPAGNARPSYWSLKAAEARQACMIGLGPWSFPHPTTDPAPRDLAELVAQQQQAVERGVETTTVTPLYGDGQWLIDTEGRVTATGDAALITGSRDLGCEPGPVTAHGADAAGWHTRPDTNLLHGTTLEDTPLDHTALAELPQPPTTESDGDRHHPPRQPPAGKVDGPVAYQDPSTSETIIVLDASRRDPPSAADQRLG